MAEAIQTRTKVKKFELNERLWDACRRGDNSEVEQYLSDGADMNYECISSVTCIGVAAHNGHVHTLLLLINRGADIRKKTSQLGMNPMHMACMGRHLEVIELLRQKGLDLHTPENKIGNTPMDILKNTVCDFNDDDFKRRRIECLTALQVDSSDTDTNSKGLEVPDAAQSGSQAVISVRDSVLQQPPIEYDVYTVLKHKAVEWNSIGRALRVEFNDREKIEKTFGLEFEDKLEKVLHMWIEYRCSEVTWQNVLDVLEELKFIDTIQSVKEYLAKPEVKNRYSHHT